MTRIETEHVLDADGVLHLDLPIGAAEAGRKVVVTVRLLPRPMTQEEYQRAVLSTDNVWQGDFERPPQCQHECREPRG